MPSINEMLARVGIKTAQAGLMVGGLIVAFVLPAMLKSVVNVSSGKRKKAANISTSYNHQGFQMLGMIMMVGGAGWFLADQKGITAASNTASEYPLTSFTPVQTGLYPNPVNDLSNVKPQNRFDKQSNYILNENNASFDNYINDIIFKEAKQVGLNLLDKSNYPVKMEPYQIKTLNPTTPIQPDRDFNTVKMIA